VTAFFCFQQLGIIWISYDYAKNRFRKGNGKKKRVAQVCDLKEKYLFITGCYLAYPSRYGTISFIVQVVL
jgi:hypothetical protein